MLFVQEHGAKGRQEMPYSHRHLCMMQRQEVGGRIGATKMAELPA